MKISDIIHFIDIKHMVLPEFQRGFVWTRKDVRALFDSLYHGYPVGSLLLWSTKIKEKSLTRGNEDIAEGLIEFILDGQQRITALYGVIRGNPPPFFVGRREAFTGLYFHLEDEEFSFYQMTKMEGDPLWINVTELMKNGFSGLAKFMQSFGISPELQEKSEVYSARLAQLLGVQEKTLLIDKVTGEDKTLDIVVDIFNRLNSKGTILSKGDLALAKIFIEWPESRIKIKEKIDEWNSYGYNFQLEWLIRSINTVLTGEAKFSFLHDKSKSDLLNGYKTATKYIEFILNLISMNLGLDHGRVLFAPNSFPVLVRYLHLKHGEINELDRGKLLFWYIQVGWRGRYSGSTESVMDFDIALIENIENGLDDLIEELRLQYGSFEIESGHFNVSNKGSRLYPILYMLARISGAKDWGTGSKISTDAIGKMNQLEVHHIFPKAQLKKAGYNRNQINSIGNFSFLSKNTNLKIGNRLPNDYFPEIESKFPGALKSQWIPMDKNLWDIDNYLKFLEERRKLLANEFNNQMKIILKGEIPESMKKEIPENVPIRNNSLFSDLDIEDELVNLNLWLDKRGLSQGMIMYDLADPNTGEQLAVLDAAWPDGLQVGLSESVAIILDNNDIVMELANEVGFRCFKSIKAFKDYVEKSMGPFDNE